MPGGINGGCVPGGINGGCVPGGIIGGGVFACGGCWSPLMGGGGGFPSRRGRTPSMWGTRGGTGGIVPP